MILELVEDESLWVGNPGGQKSFLDDYEHRYVAFAAGWGTGKTWAGARKSTDLHILNSFDDDGQPTFSKGLIIEPTLSLAKTIAIPEMQRAFDEAGLSHKFIADPSRFYFVLPDLGTKSNPSQILVRTAESPMAITGFEVSWIWGDEAARWYSNPDDPMLDALVQADGRLRCTRARFHQMNLTFTHEGDGTPVYRRFEEESRDNHAIYHGRTEENPKMAAYAAEQRKQLTPELVKQYLEGGAATFRGSRVFGAFSEQNVESKLVLDPNLPLHLSMDFNIDPGMHGILGQHYRDRDCLTAVHELHGKSMSTLQMLDAFRSLVATMGGWKWPMLEIYGDPAGNARFEATGESCWQIVFEWFRVHMPNVIVKNRTRSSHSPVADRVNAQNCALRTVDGKIRYYVHPRCERLIQDFKSLKWDGNEVNKKDRKLSHASEAEGHRVEQLMPIRQRSYGALHVGTV